MKRRRFVRALAGTPALSALFVNESAGQAQTGAQGSQQPPQQATQPGAPVNPALPIQPPARASEELPRLNPSVPDAAGEMMPRFFTQLQFAALQRLSELLMPAGNGAPGALDAHAPEFLDFLVSESLPEKQQIYRAGLDGLNAQSRKKFSKTFAEIEPAQATTLLAPLNEKWTYDQPSDAVGRFLRVAKADVRTATMNSREYSSASAAGGRRAGGGGIYWYPLD